MEAKQEFLDGLRRALTGKLSPQEVEEYIRYYDEYITAEIRNARQEKDVLDSLGSPRLIAMSICDANAAGEKTEGTNGASEYKNYETNTRQNGEEWKDDRPFMLRHPKMTIMLIVVAIIVVLCLGIWLAVSLVSFLWPIIVVIVAAILIIRLISYIRQNW